jgi:hypothetical protein
MDGANRVRNFGELYKFIFDPKAGAIMKTIEHQWNEALAPYGALT